MASVADVKTADTQPKTSNIPIDIHYNKLQDWLLKRRHCKQEWSEAALDIRNKINIAIRDMPEHPDVTALLHGSYINYFHCVRIIGILKETELASKNIFGHYSSQRMKDWLEIVKLYEKDCVYLAEAAQMLSRYVNYEIPAMKKQLANCRKTEEECTRKEAEHAGAAADCRQKFADACKQMGIEGKRIKAELINLAGNLPQTFDVIAKRCQTLRDAVSLYKSFAAFTSGSASVSQSVCPMLQTVMNKGNITTYEWRTGVVPHGIISQDNSSCNVSVTAQHQKPGSTGDGNKLADEEEIDWSAADEIDPVPSAIDFGDEQDIEIELADEGISEIGVTWDDGCTANPSDGGESIARGRDALTLLDNPTTRFQFVDELIEVENFLAQRLIELQKGMDVIMTSLLQSAPAAVVVAAEDVACMREAVSGVLEDVTSTRTQQLMSIRNSPRYVDRVTEKLQKIHELSEKMAASSRLMVLKRQEALDEHRQLEPKLTVLIVRTKELKAQIEKDISKRYENRVVNIMGEINAI